MVKENAFAHYHNHVHILFSDNHKRYWQCKENNQRCYRSTGYVPPPLEWKINYNLKKKQEKKVKRGRAKYEKRTHRDHLSHLPPYQSTCKLHFIFLIRPVPLPPPHWEY